MRIVALVFTFFFAVLADAQVPTGVCQLYMRSPRGGDVVAFCSGSLIGNRIITNQHCLENMIVAKITCTGGIEVDLTNHLVKKSIRRDLGVILLNKTYQTDIQLPETPKSCDLLVGKEKCNAYGFGQRDLKREVTKI